MTPDDFVLFDPAAMTIPDIYRLLTAIIVPRPIAFVSTVSPSGIENLAPFSFFMGGGSNPPSIAFSPAKDRAGEKDTLQNIESTGEFVVNTVHREMAQGMNSTSRRLAPDESEWPESGFTQVPSVHVRPARVAESLAQFECRLFQIVRHGDGAAAARYVIGEVVAMHVAASALHERSSLELVARLGGADYLDLGDGRVFTLTRP